jgi:hypothetical protein
MVVGPIVLLVRCFLLPTLSLLGIGGAGFGEGFGAKKGGLIWLELFRLQSLLDSDVVAKKMGKRRFTQFQCRADRLGCGGIPDQASEILYALVKRTLAILPNPLRMSDSPSWVFLKVEKRHSTS